MKNILLSVFILLSISSFCPDLMAQKTSREVLDQVSEKLLSYNTLQADFSFTLQNTEADIRDTQIGSLVFQGEKFRLSLMGSLILSNGNMMWSYLEDLNEASILDPSESDFFNPKNIFTLYKQDFTLNDLGQEKSIQSIELIPNIENEDYKRIILKIDIVRDLIREVTYEGLDGNEYIILITNIIPNIQVDDRFFTFDKEKYPGVQIYDMR